MQHWQVQEDCEEFDECDKDHDNSIESQPGKSRPRKINARLSRRVWWGRWRYWNSCQFQTGVFHVYISKKQIYTEFILDRHKFEDEEEIIFETDEEAIIAKNIIEEVSG